MTENLILHTERQGPIAVLDISGYINNTGGEQIAEACKELMAEGVDRFLIDLGQCGAVNSVGISIFIELIEKAKSKGGRIAFCRAEDVVARALRIMGLLKHSSLHDSRAEAVEALEA